MFRSMLVEPSYRMGDEGTLRNVNTSALRARESWTEVSSKSYHLQSQKNLSRGRRRLKLLVRRLSGEIRPKEFMCKRTSHLTWSSRVLNYRFRANFTGRFLQLNSWLTAFRSLERKTWWMITLCLSFTDLKRNVLKIYLNRLKLKGQSHELRMRDFLPLGALTQ